MGENQRTAFFRSFHGASPRPGCASAHKPLIRPALRAQGDEEEENVPPPYKYEGPRDEGASLEISVTIEPEEGAEEGAEKKVRTKSITLLGARKGPGGKAVYPNGDGFEGGYHAGKRHGAAGSYTHAAMSRTSWLSLRPAGAPEAACSAGASLRLPQALASLRWAALACHTGLVFVAGMLRSRRRQRERTRYHRTASTRARGRRARSRGWV